MHELIETEDMCGTSFSVSGGPDGNSEILEFPTVGLAVVGIKSTKVWLGLLAEHDKVA